MLTDNAIRTFRAANKSRKLFDEKGLYLLVTPAGARLWRFKYRFPPRTPDNKEKCISLGTWPEVSLEQARERRDAARQDVASGLDPTLRRTCEKVCLGDTFEAVAREFLSVLRAANLPVETPSPAAAHLIGQALTSPRYRRPRSRETDQRRHGGHHGAAPGIACLSVSRRAGGPAAARPGAAGGLAAHRVPRHL